jgi:hypothetical protein
MHLLGLLGAFVLNYIFGIVLYNLYRFSTDQKIMARYLRLADIFKKYGGSTFALQLYTKHRKVYSFGCRIYEVWHNQDPSLRRD